MLQSSQQVVVTREKRSFCTCKYPSNETLGLFAPTLRHRPFHHQPNRRLPPTRAIPPLTHPDRLPIPRHGTGLLAKQQPEHGSQHAIHRGRTDRQGRERFRICRRSAGQDGETQVRSTHLPETGQGGSEAGA